MHTIARYNYTACDDFPTGVARHPRAATQWYRLLLLAMHCQWEWVSSFSFFCPWWPWPLTLTFELGRDFCTVYV